jgi:hypothetical protein
MMLALEKTSAPAELHLPKRQDIWRQALSGLRVPEKLVVMPADPERRERCRYNLLAFATTYFPRQAAQNALQFIDPSPFHTEFLGELQSLILAKAGVHTIARAAPRSGGKTTLVIIAILWAILYRHRVFPMVLGSNGTNAESRMLTLQDQLLNNPLIKADFPEIVLRLWEMHGGDPRRAPKMFPWTSSATRIPNGCWIHARGMDSSLPGAAELAVRPDFVVIDDMETVSSINSSSETKVLRERLEKEVLHLHTEGLAALYVYICTIRKRGCISDRLTDQDRAAGWRGKRYRGLIDLPKNSALWESFETICRQKEPKITDDFASPDATRQALGIDAESFAAYTAGYVAALRYYVGHRAEMDEGARVLDPLRLPIYRVYQIKATEGEAGDVFFCEIQNDPPDQNQEALDRRAWTPEFIASHATAYKPLELPDDCPAEFVTMGLDVHKQRMYYVFRAWAADATSWQIEAGVGEVNLHPGADQVELQRAQINALREIFALSQAGFKCGNRTLALRFGFVDEGWETDLVRAFCRETKGLWRPIKGIPGQRVPRVAPGKDNPFTLNLGIYHFKHDLARFLERSRNEQRAEPGFFHLHNSPRHSYTVHMTSEEWRPKAHREGTDPEEYEWVTVNRNNHWWDAEVYAWAVAYACGLRCNFMGTKPSIAQHVPRAAPSATNQTNNWRIGR